MDPDPRLYMLAGTLALLLVAITATVISVLRTVRARNRALHAGELAPQPVWSELPLPADRAFDANLDGLKVEVAHDSPSAALLTPMRTTGWAPADEPAPPNELHAVSLDKRIAEHPATSGEPSWAKSVPDVASAVPSPPIQPASASLVEQVPSVVPPVVTAVAPIFAPTTQPAPAPAQLLGVFPASHTESLPSIELATEDEAFALAAAFPLLDPTPAPEPALARTTADSGAGQARDVVSTPAPQPDIGPASFFEPVAPAAPIPILAPSGASGLDLWGDSQSGPADELTSQPAVEPVPWPEARAEREQPAGPRANVDASQSTIGSLQTPESAAEHTPTLPAPPAPAPAVSRAPAPELRRPAPEPATIAPQPPLPIAPGAPVRPAVVIHEPPADAAPQPDVEPSPPIARPTRPRAVVRAVDSAASDQAPRLEPMANPQPDQPVASRELVPEFALAAPVEMWFGEHRVGVKAGTRTYDQFRRYADTLFDDLKAADTP